MEARKTTLRFACRCLRLCSPFHTASGYRQRFVRRSVAVAVFDVATATIYVIFFVDGRSFRSGGDLFGRPFALSRFAAAGFRLACTFRQFSLPDIRKNTSIKNEECEKITSAPWSLLEPGLIYRSMIVASATLVNARLILVDGVEAIGSAKRQYRNANARHGKLANYALIRAASV